YKATADSPAQNSYGMPIDILFFDGEVLRFSIEKLKVKYDGTIVQPDSISGDFVQNGATFPLGFRKIEGEEVLSKEEVQEEEAKEEVVVQKEVTGATSENMPDSEIAAKIKSIEPLLENVLQNYHAAGYAVAVVNKDGIVYSK